MRRVNQAQAEQADRLANDPAFEDACRDVKADLMQEWETTLPGDQEARERIWQRHQAVDEVAVMLKKKVDAFRVDAQRAARKK